MQKIKSEKIGKFLVVLFLVGIASMLIILWSIFSEHRDNYNNQLFCKSKDGEFRRGICIMKTDDYGKVCKGNEFCKGECVIKNWEKLLEKWIISFGKETLEIKLKEFEERTGEKVEGYCSEVLFKDGNAINMEHCSRLAPVYIEKGIIYKNINPGQIPSWGCRDIPQ